MDIHAFYNALSPEWKAILRDAIQRDLADEKGFFSAVKNAFIKPDLESMKQFIHQCTTIHLFGETSGPKRFHTQIASLDPLEPFPNLKHLDIGSQPLLTEIKSIRKIRSLIRLEIAYCRSIRDWEYLNTCSELQALYLKETNFTDFACINKLSNIRELSYEGERYVLNLAACHSLHNLVGLNISNVDWWDFSFIRELKNLEHVFLPKTTLNTLDPFRDLPMIKRIDVSNTLVSMSEIDDFARNHPHIAMEY